MLSTFTFYSRVYHSFYAKRGIHLLKYQASKIMLNKINVLDTKKQDKESFNRDDPSYCRCYPIVISWSVQCKYSLSLIVYISSILGQYSLIFYRVKNEKYCLPRSPGARLCIRWPILLCAHQRELYLGNMFPKNIFLYFRKILGEMRRAWRQRLDHRDLQLRARRLQGELRQPPQDHRGRLHRQHELPPHGEV